MNGPGSRRNLSRCNTDEDDIDAVDLQNCYSQMKDKTDSAEASEKAKGGKKREKLVQKRKWRESQLIDNMVNVICNDAELVHKLYNSFEKNSQVQLRPLITNTKARLE